ncbi:peroxiredoxin [Alsobacter sp. SYSU BS001988]|jgi:peroxiredoxin
MSSSQPGDAAAAAAQTPSHDALPADLPVPVNDGATDHLRAMQLPQIPLPSTSGGAVSLGGLNGLTVVYAYPRTGEPGKPSPDGWDAIPGARGCTPQSCSFRDHFAELRGLGVDHVFGLSTQTTDYQSEMAERLHLPFAILSDHAFALTDAIRLPTFEAGGMRLLKRFTLMIDNGRVAHVFYPVFPPDRSAQDVVDWLKARP